MTPEDSLLTFATEEESARAFAIVTEDDAFRLVIRGSALVEDVLDRAIDAAFRDGTPNELGRLRLPARVALAEALELITREVAAAIKALARIRNRLAHGDDDAVTPEEIRSLREVSEPFIGDDVDLDRWAEADQLRIAVAVIWQATGFTADYALQKRAEADTALAEWRARNALSAERVRELVEHDDTNPNG